MRVMGIDYSSRSVDCVSVPYEGDGAPIWTRFPLTGNDAFDRTRSVADAMPGRGSAFFDEVVAVGIEHPAGKFGTGDMLRVQGAILSCLPARMLVEPWPPAKWRKAVGLPGNASKDAVASWAWERLLRDPLLMSNSNEPVYWPQDAIDAWCLALATRQAITRKQAA